MYYLRRMSELREQGFLTVPSLMPLRRALGSRSSRVPPPLLDRTNPIPVCDPYLRSIMSENNPLLNFVECDGKCCGGKPPLPYRFNDQGDVVLSGGSARSGSETTEENSERDGSRTFVDALDSAIITPDDRPKKSQYFEELRKTFK